MSGVTFDKRLEAKSERNGLQKGSETSDTV